MLCGPREPLDYPVDRLVFRTFASRSLDHRTSWKVPRIVASCRIAICLGHLNHRITSRYAAAHEQIGSAAKLRDLSFLIGGRWALRRNCPGPAARLGTEGLRRRDFDRTCFGAPSHGLPRGSEGPS